MPVDPAKVAPSTAPKVEYLMWSEDHAYMRDCSLHIKGNATWGKLHAPYADKVEAKDIVANMGVPGLNVIPTLAVLDGENVTAGEYTLEFMRGLRQPYIIKSAHLSGGVARVYDDKYHCFKYCINDTILPLGHEAHRISKQQLAEDLNLKYSKLGNEMQYDYIPPRVIFEEDILSNNRTSTDVTFWWLSNGHPVFVSEQCELPRNTGQQGFEMKRVFVNTDFRKLPIVFNRDVCDTLPPKPATWNAQLEIMKRVGRAFPGEVVRVDVYGGGEEVWFSEFTFTTAGCWRRFTPALTDGLLYGLMKGEISSDVVTPTYVERMLNDKSWVVISTVDEGMRVASTMLRGEFPSPVDLCLEFKKFGNDEGGGGGGATRNTPFERCIRKARSVQKYQLRCIVSVANATRIRAFGMDGVGDEVSGIAACIGKEKRMP